MIPTLFLPPIAVFVFFIVMYVIALVRKDNSVADVAWGLGFMLVAITGFIVNHSYVPRSVLVLGLVSVWGLRLATHIFVRNRGKGEDYRYQAWRSQWGEHVALRSFLQVFLLQAVFLLVVSLPVQLTMHFFGTQTFTLIDSAGLVLWTFGFAFESIGDAQLNAFKKNPENKGHILQSGLWKYTRHPNYFGESLMWWAIALIASQVPFGYVGFLGALTITLMIRFVSGVPLLEKKYEGREDWEAYKKETPVFIPLRTKLW